MRTDKQKLRKCPTFEANWAWAAGLFEGEGNVNQAHRHGIRARIKMTDEEPIRQFHAIVGVGKVSGPHGGYNYKDGSKRKPYWEWSVCNRPGILYILSIFEDWLSPRRINQFREVLFGTNG